MASDFILDALCEAGMARKTIGSMPGPKPQQPHRDLGSRYDTTFYNPLTLYTVELLVVQQDNTRVILKPGGEKRVGEVPQNLSKFELNLFDQFVNWCIEKMGNEPTSLDRFIKSMQVKYPQGMQQTTGAQMWGIDRRGGHRYPYKAKYITDSYDMTEWM